MLKCGTPNVFLLFLKKHTLKNLNNFNFIETLQRYYREFLYTPHSVSPNVGVLCNHRTSAKPKKFTLVHWSRELHCIWSSCLPGLLWFGTVSQSSLFLMTLTVLRSPGEAFCRMSLSLSLSDFFFAWLDLGYEFLGKNTTKVKCRSHRITSGGKWYQHDFSLVMSTLIPLYVF